MRPPILVVIFDFLVGSFLLFVVAPDTGHHAIASSKAFVLSEAGEFSPAAVSAYFDERADELDSANDTVRLAEAEAEKRKLEQVANNEAESAEAVRINLEAARRALRSQEQEIVEKSTALAIVEAEKKRLQDELVKEKFRATEAVETAASAEAKVEQQTAAVEQMDRKVAEATTALEDAQKAAASAEKKAEQQAATMKQMEQKVAEATAARAPQGSDLKSPAKDEEGRGPYQQIVPARMEVSISMVEDDYAVDDHEAAQVFPVAFSVRGRRFVAMAAEPSGLDWGELVGDGDLIDLKVTYGSAQGNNRWSSAATHELLAVGAEPRLVLLEILDSQGDSLPARSLVGRDEIASKGPPEVAYLVKATESAPISRVDLSVDQSNRNYLSVTRPMLSLKDDLPLIGDPAKQVEPGDYVVTAAGEIIAVVVDENVAFVLDPADLDDIAFRMPLLDLPAFVKEAKARREAAKKL